MILGCMVIISGQTGPIASFVVCYLDTQSIDKSVKRNSIVYFLTRIKNKIVSEYYQEIPLSQTADKPVTS